MPKPPHRFRRRFIAGAIVLASVLSTVGGSVLAGFFVVLPALSVLPAARAMPMDTLVYDRNGVLIADLHNPDNSRLPVPLASISPLAVKATIDTEDRNFWHEGNGIDVNRLVSAAVQDVHGSAALQGASTIPMQLVKLLYLRDDRSIAYKLRDLTLAMRLTSQEPKAQILNDYLNDLPYGNRAIGIQAAAHTYFGVDAGKLDLAQAAFLAGLPNQPSTNNPYVFPANAHAREVTVLEAMLRAGDITQAQLTKASAEKLHLIRPVTDDYDAAPPFVARVVSEIKARTGRNAYTDGLRIKTSLDLKLQSAAAAAVTQQVQAVGSLNVTDGALVSLSPQTGEVFAYVGSAGPNVPGADIDMAAAPRQPGSTFKLFTYSSAIADKKISMLTPVLDEPLRFATGGGPDGMQPYIPLDYDRRWHGVVPAALAIGNSLNVPAIRVEMAEGLPAILARARAMGVTTLTKPDLSYGVSTTLGTVAIPLWQMAQAASAIASGGVLNGWHTVISVTDIGGKPIALAPLAHKTVLSPQAAAVMNDTLSTDSNRWLEFGRGGALTLPGHRVAAKTGTSEDFRDNFTIGWTPHLLTATWVGNADNSQMHGTTGITGAAPIWHQFMSTALAGVPDAWPALPPGVHYASSGGHTALLIDGTSATTGANLLGAGGKGGAGISAAYGVVSGGGGGGRRHRKHG